MSIDINCQSVSGLVSPTDKINDFGEGEMIGSGAKGVAGLAPNIIKGLRNCLYVALTKDTSWFVCSPH